MVLFLGALLVVGAFFQGFRENQSYRARKRGTWNGDTDLFVYTKGRWWARLIGAVAVAGLGATLIAWELLPPVTPSELNRYLATTGMLIALLVGAAYIDLKITTKTARPNAFKRREDQPRQKSNH